MRTEQAREAIDVAVSVGVEDVRPFAALDHDQVLTDRAEVAVAREMHQQLLPRGAGQLLSGPGGRSLELLFQLAGS